MAGVRGEQALEFYHCSRQSTRRGGWGAPLWRTDRRWPAAACALRPAKKGKPQWRLCTQAAPPLPPPARLASVLVWAKYPPPLDPTRLKGAPKLLDVHLVFLLQHARDVAARS